MMFSSVAQTIGGVVMLVVVLVFVLLISGYGDDLIGMIRAVRRKK